MTDAGSVILRIRFESHATSVDNEAGLASGWTDPPLSTLGHTQARDLGRRLAGDQFDVVACSDLQRSYRTAELAFPDVRSLLRSPALRECDYGSLNGAPKAEVEVWKQHPLDTPFSQGESFVEAARRVDAFLVELARTTAYRRVLVIGHRSTHHAIAVRSGVRLTDAVRSPWHWQPGWEYDCPFPEA